MIKAGLSNSSNANTTDVQYLGEETGFKPQLELAKYISLLALQKKTQADDRYGGYTNAGNFGFGMFGYNPFGNAAEAENPTPPAVPPKTGKPPIEEPPPVGVDGTPKPKPGPTPSPSPTPTPTPPPGGGAPPKNPDTGSNGPPAQGPPKGGTRAPFNDVPFVATAPPSQTTLPQNPTVDELARRWAAARR